MISPDTFSIFWKFWFSGFLGGKRAKNGHKWQKVCCAFYLRNHTSYDCDFWYTCNIMTYPDAFFHFFKILIFGVVRGVKGQKMAQNDNFFCLTACLRNRTLYDSGFSCTCKMMISPGIFSCFLILSFLDVRFWGG